MWQDWRIIYGQLSSLRLSFITAIKMLLGVKPLSFDSGEARCGAELEGWGHNVPAVVMMTAMILQQTSSSQERSRARPGNKTQPGSIIWGLFPFEWVFHLHQGCCPVETKIPPFSPPLRFFLDCVNTLKILPVGWISRPATPWQTAVWWNNHFNSSPASARLGRIHNIHCVEKPWNKSVSVA